MEKKDTTKMIFYPYSWLSMVYQWINNHYDKYLKNYKGYQKFQNCKEKLFPYRPEEAAMFGCKSLSTEII